MGQGKLQEHCGSSGLLGLNVAQVVPHLAILQEGGDGLDVVDADILDAVGQPVGMNVKSLKHNATSLFQVRVRQLVGYLVGSRGASGVVVTRGQSNVEVNVDFAILAALSFADDDIEVLVVGPLFLIHRVFHDDIITVGVQNGHTLQSSHDEEHHLRGEVCQLPLNSDTEVGALLLEGLRDIVADVLARHDEDGVVVLGGAVQESGEEDGLQVLCGDVAHARHGAVVVVEAGVGELGEGIGGVSILISHNFTSFLCVCICAE